MNFKRSSLTLKATEEMNRRVSVQLKRTSPLIDLNDIYKKRQFAPEYSQSAYKTMFCEEFAIGDYLNTTTEKYLQINGEDRKSMVLLL